ncbi:hypothetical protein B5K11_02605 [Rhizobium leguminosarum bv. trifolii]|uniref:hypothetical protein n=1 Tax=Rhizobium leguminosarum TaxID=384 RepID=UPI000E2FB11C|nr:hypothetical protein [Rhizobium leguminosarum]RFB99339.1 hypothetical protein B5K11_02605 [Rhizobium leguminosarum bv. trifolii]
MFKTFAGIELFRGLQDQKFIKRYDNHITGPPLDMVILCVFILFAFVVSPRALEIASIGLRSVLTFLPKYYFELPWLAENHQAQVSLYTCISFLLIMYTAFKTSLFSLYIISIPMSREILVKDRKVVVKTIAIYLLVFFTLIFLFPLPIYGAGASTTLVGNAYFLTFFNILFLWMLSGGISATVLLCKRSKKRD